MPGRREASVLTGDCLLAGRMPENQTPGAVYPMKSRVETVL